MPGGRRDGAGRRPIEIDLVELEKLSALHCTHEEIAGWLGCSVRTVEKYVKKPEIASAMARGCARGRISVRRAQMKLLETGNAAIGIWLGKQLLGQRDVQPIELTGAQGKPLEFSIEVIDAILEQSKKDG